MKIYTVILETYYDDFSGGGTYELAKLNFTSKEEADKYFDGMKEIVREREAPTLGRYGSSPEEHLVETDGYYGVCDDSSMCYWGSAVRIEESETQDGIPFRKEDWCEE